MHRWTVTILVATLLGAAALLSVALPSRFPAATVGEFQAAPVVLGEAETVRKALGPATVRLRFKGLEVEVLGIVFFSIIVVLAHLQLRAAQTQSSPAASRLGNYTFFFATVGTAGVLWIGYDGGFARAVRLPAQYWIAASAILAILAISARWPVVHTSRSASETITDLVLLVRSPLSWAAAGLAVVLVVTQRAPQARSSAPMGAAFVQWFVGQPRLEMPDRFRRETGVSFVTFIDYQCPACRSAATYYAALFEELNRTYPGAITFWTVDFPLDSECNGVVSLPSHTAACEAAAAVRLARRESRQADSSSALEQWLWSNQAQLSPHAVFDAFRRFQPTETLESRYAELLEEIRRDVSVGQELGVRVTPTYFLNGVRLPFVPAVNLKAAIVHELESSTAKAR